MRRRIDDDVVLPFFNDGPQLSQLSTHRAQAIGFLHPPVVDIADCGASSGKQSRSANRHRGIGYMIQIDIDPFQLAIAADFDPFIRPGHLGTHQLQYLGKARIALHTGLAGAMHPDAATGNRGRRQKIRSGRRIAFDHDMAGTAVVLAAADKKRLIIAILHFDTEATHHIQRNVDIRFGYQLTDDVDGQILLAERRSHQHRSQKLTGKCALNIDTTALQTMRMDLQWWIACILQVVDSGTGLMQCIHQIADRTLVHARLTG